MELKNKRLSAYPLLLKDPFFSFWSDVDDPTENDVVFWHGEKKPLRGTVEVDGREYRFLGRGDAPALKLVTVSLSAFTTEYVFSGDGFLFEVSFLSPLTPDNLDVFSLPVTYVDYKFSSAKKARVAVRLKMEERCVYNTCFDEERREEVRINKYVLGGTEAVGMGLVGQAPLSNSLDESGADWGYMYLTGEKVGEINDGRKWCYAENRHYSDCAAGFFCVAFDDVVSIFYYGQYLKNYWQRDGKTIFDAISYGVEHKDEIDKICRRFDEKLRVYAKDFSENYLFVLYASLRQSAAAHKLVADMRGRIIFLSKECNSDGCIATVDVSYPSVPLYLIFNPELVKGMMLPILDYARMKIWKDEFAPHDAGIYPYCVGQFYAVRKNDEKQTRDLYARFKAKNEVLPFYYELPSDYDLYDFERQMPVEESGNMIIMAYLYYCASGDIDYLSSNCDLFEKWVRYLADFGLLPENQLCTDDFAGHLDKNANLAVKAVIGIRCFAEISAALGKEEAHLKYCAISEDYSSRWKTLYCNDEHSFLSYGNENSFSLKYNMAVDGLLGFGLFSDDVIKKELAYYDKKANRYGVPLDSRKTYTKTDWMLWIASLGDEELCDRYSAYIVDYLNDTKARVPFPDWTETVSADYYMFRNRTVQGGTFFPLLKKLWKDIKK